MPNDPNEFRSTSYLAQPGCRVYHSLTTTISTGTTTTLSFDSERYDPFGMHTAVSVGRITVTVPGRYLVGATVDWAVNTTGSRLVWLQINGATTIIIDSRQAATAGFRTRQSVNTVYDFVNGDYIEVLVFQNSGGNLDIASTGDFTPEFWAQRLG